MKKIQTGDSVIVIAGKGKGTTSTVVGFVGDDRVIVKGVNTAKKAVK
jgi:ribosomal protein L24